MTFKSWLQNLESTRGVGSMSRGLGRPRRRSSSSSHLGRKYRPRSASPFLEQLETRLTLSATTLASFIAPAGLSPQAAVISDGSGNLFGTTSAGGASGDGTIFEVSQAGGTPVALASFNGANGARPLASLIVDGSGNLFGTTLLGGASSHGTVFELAKGSGTIKALASFNGTTGVSPYGSLIADMSGNLFGTTSMGGAHADGTVFELAQGSGTITALASFNGTNGSTPRAGLVMDGSGNLYGTASIGGTSNDGTVFELAKGSNTITALASFDRTNGANPYGGLIVDSSGNLYGTTEGGGAASDGTVFELSRGSGIITALASFNGTDGAEPYATLIMDSGNLYGTTDVGGASRLGTVFELAQGSGTITLLASFNGYVGRFGPRPGLLMDGGNLYGTTEGGGASNEGTVFELAQGSGTITSLASFGETQGANPQAGLVMDKSGNLYGTASSGGDSNEGTVFELAQGSGTIMTLASFNGANGREPEGALVMDGSGNLYGTALIGGASNDGTVFELAKGSGTITVLASFNGTNGAEPEAGLLMDGSGNLYGTASIGGTSNDGTVFELAKGGGTITALASFNGSNGADPQDALIMDGSGNLYGTASGVSAGVGGRVFELAHGSGAITALASCVLPYGALMLDSSGNLYGTESAGGASDVGDVFELARGSGTITTLASFNGTNGASPYAGVIMDGSGNLYGTTYQGGASSEGAVFKLARGSGTLTLLASFSSVNGGPIGGLIMDGSGNLYGTTRAGGAGNLGTVFEVANPATTLAIGGFPSHATAGAAGTFTIAARNADGTTDTAYTGTVHFTSSDAQAGLPADYTFTAADAGEHNFGATLKTAGTQALTATDTASGFIGGTEAGIVVKPAAASRLIIGGVPGVTLGVPFSLTLSLVNAYGNLATGYVGTLHFSSSDSTATLPANYTFSAADAGQHTFNITMRKPGNQTLAVADTRNSTLKSSVTIDVVGGGRAIRRGQDRHQAAVGLLPPSKALIASIWPRRPGHAPGAMGFSSDRRLPGL